MGRINSIETLAAVDGPGLRMGVFFQGCPLRCLYCHNPEMWEIECGTEMSAAEIALKAARMKPYFKQNGGITLTGGEPFMQADFALEILQLCKKEGIHTAVDTCGYYFNDIVKKTLDYTDLVILDIKHTNIDECKRLTGEEISFDFLEYIKNRPHWIRQVIVPGLTDSEENIKKLSLLSKHAEKVELLPYHQMGIFKYQSLGIEYPLKDTAEPTVEDLACLEKIIFRR